MNIVKSFGVGNGDMFYIKHASDNFTIIDCNLGEGKSDVILNELKKVSKGKTIKRFISTHPDQDHFNGIELLDEHMEILNFYVVDNNVIKSDETVSFQKYCELRDHKTKAFKIYKNCQRKWMNQSDDVRGSAGLEILWPDITNLEFKDALGACEKGDSPNNISSVIHYRETAGASFLWLGDLETEFMESIKDEINLSKTTVVFAAHHGRKSGKIPNSWLEILDPQIIVLGEAPSRHLNYYTGYNTLTQNTAGDITFLLEEDMVHIYSSNEDYDVDFLPKEHSRVNGFYLGSLEVETEYTL